MNARISPLLGLAVALAGSVVAPSAFAQGAVTGELRDVKGSVMVLKGKDYVNGTVGTALAAGDRVLVLEKAQARLALNVGGQRCEIDLRENQALTVSGADCKALVAAVQTVPGAGAPGSAAVAAGTAGAGAAAGYGAGVSGGVMLGGAAVLGGALLVGTKSTVTDTRLKASGD